MAKKSGKVTKRKAPAKPKAKATSKKTPAKVTTNVVAENGPRRLKRIRRIPNAFKITKAAYATVKKQPKLFIGIVLIYGLLNLILVKGLAGTTDVGNLKAVLESLFKGQFGSLFSGLGVFAVLVGSAGSGNTQDAGAYQLILAIIFSLTIVWALRQVSSDQKPRIRDAFYNGMYPLVPFILVLLFIFIELIPLIIGGWIYSNVLSANVAITGSEQALFIGILVVLAGFSFYLISSSIIALYIVTLPDMTPMKAIRSAKTLVKKRRLMVFRKLVFLPLMLLVIACIIMLPIIFLLTGIAQWIFFVLTMFAVLAVNSFIYTVYRELLNE